MTFDSAELAPTLEHVISRSEFSEFKSQVLEVCQKYWNYGKTLPAWFRFAWPKFLVFLVVLGAGIVVYGMATQSETVVQSGFAVAIVMPLVLSFVGMNIKKRAMQRNKNDTEVDPQLDAVVVAWNARLADRGYLVYVRRQYMHSEGGMIDVREMQLNVGSRDNIANVSDTEKLLTQWTA